MLVFDTEEGANAELVRRIEAYRGTTEYRIRKYESVR
jgi:hypothetical protein